MEGYNVISSFHLFFILFILFFIFIHFYLFSFSYNYFCYIFLVVCLLCYWLILLRIIFFIFARVAIILTYFNPIFILTLFMYLYLSQHTDTSFYLFTFCTPKGIGATNLHPFLFFSFFSCFFLSFRQLFRQSV